MRLPAARRGSMKLAVILSLVAVVVLALAAVLIFYPWDPGPSGRFSVKPITVAKEVSTVAAMPTGAGDAADDVQQAIANFLDRAKEIRQQRAASRADVKELTEQLDAIEKAGVSAGTILPFTCSRELLAAAGKGEFNYAEKYLKDAKLEWRDPERLLYAMEYVGTTAILEGDIAEKQGKPEQAEQIYTAVLIYGKRLADTQVRVWIQLEGLTAEESAARALTLLWEESDAAKAQAALDYYNAVTDAHEKIDATFGELCRRANQWHAGDLLLFARKHGEPAWRIEAILTMGMARQFPPGRKYNKALMRYLKKAIHDENPWVAKAAEWSYDLTPEGANTQTSGIE